MSRLRRLIAAGVLGGGGAAVDPAPFLDSFDRADGAIGNGWTGATWTIATNKAINTPVGTELITNGTFTEWVDGTPTGFTKHGLRAGDEVTEVDPTEGHGGTGNGAANIYAAAGGRGLRSAAFTAAAAKWLRLTFTESKRVAGNLNSYIGADVISASEGAKVQTHPGGTTFVSFVSSGGALDATIDDVSLKEIGLAELSAVRGYPIADVRISVDILRNGFAWQGGLVVMDNPANPLNGLAMYYNIPTSGGAKKFVLDQWLNGVRTNLVNAALTLANLSLVHKLILNISAGTYTMRCGVYGATTATVEKMVTSVAIAETAIQGCKYFGIFSPDQNITFNNFTLHPMTKVKKVFFIGDSKLTQYYKFDVQDFTNAHYAFDEVLPRAATASHKIADTKAGIDAALAATSETPDLVFMNVGVNDANATPVTDEAQFKADYQYVLDAVHAKWAAAKVYIMNGVYRTSKPAECATVSGWINTVMLANPTFCYPWADELVWYAPNMATYSADNVHYSAAGVTEAARLGYTAAGMA